MKSHPSRFVSVTRVAPTHLPLFCKGRFRFGASVNSILASGFDDETCARSINVNRNSVIDSARRSSPLIMSDDDVDPELVELLRQRFGLSGPAQDGISSDTGVLKDAEYICNNAIDVSIDMYGTKAAAESIHEAMLQRAYSTHTWSEHELHPTKSQGLSDVDLVNFVFTIDLLNFS